MSWDKLASWASDKRCDEARRYGRCGCRSGRKGKKYNPCDLEAAIVRSCEAIQQGAEPEKSASEMLEWANRMTCHASRAGRSCNHRGCIRGEECVDFLQHITTEAAAA